MALIVSCQIFHDKQRLQKTRGSAENQLGQGLFQRKVVFADEVPPALLHRKVVVFGANAARAQVQKGQVSVSKRREAGQRLHPRNAQGKRNWWVGWAS